jgi:hypothetical protein
MTYGVDQCRVCGTAIRPRGPKSWEEQDHANRKPTIPEAEWRRRGYLTSPTRSQLRMMPADGCCRPCGIKQMEKRFHYFTRAVVLAVVIVSVLAGIFTVITYLPH